MIEKDYFKLSYLSFKAVSWIWILFLILGIIGILRSLDGNPDMAITWTLQSGISLIAYLVTARLFKNRSPKAIMFGYISLALTLILTLVFFRVAPNTSYGIAFIAIFVYIGIVVYRAQRQMWRAGL